MPDPATDRDVVIYVYDGVELLDVAGPSNVLSAATRLRGSGYRVRLVAQAAGPVTTAGGLQVVAERCDRAPQVFDSLIVPGGLHLPSGHAEAIQALARRAGRVVGVCTGAMLLAEAGLLRGKRAATHWVVCRRLADLEPTCRVDPDAIYVRDGAVWTSAGVTAGMDLALALVEADFGADLALQVARWLVMHRRRYGGQSQFSAALAAQKAAPGPIKQVTGWARENLQADLSVPALARRAGMSRRNFARQFKEEVGQTPASWVERARVDEARALLEGSGASIQEIAARCGFGSPSSMHRVFGRRLGISPSGYRATHRGSQKTRSRQV